MLNTFGDSFGDNLRDLQKTSEAAAGRVAQSAGKMAGHLEGWAEEGIGSTREAIRSAPLFWGAAFSLGMAALVGLFAYKRVGFSTTPMNRSAGVRQSVKHRSKRVHARRSKTAG